MRLFGVTMVRNEADVIEAFVRHNLSVLDGLTVVDHGSLDATAGILAKLQAEGLPLRVERHPDPDFRQSEIMTTLARAAFERDVADFVFALDGDEFLKVESRASLETALSLLPPGVHAWAHWLTYVPDDLAPTEATFGPGHLWWRLRHENKPLHKVIVARVLLSQPDALVRPGNHSIIRPGVELAHGLIIRDVVAYAHCPVRSCEQLATKAILGYLASTTASEMGPQRPKLWRDLYEQLRAGMALTEDQARQIACNYGLSKKRWLPVSQIELVEDPVRLVFEQRYGSDATCISVPRLLCLVEEMIAAKRD